MSTADPKDDEAAETLADLPAPAGDSPGLSASAPSTGPQDSPPIPTIHKGQVGPQGNSTWIPPTLNPHQLEAYRTSPTHSRHTADSKRSSVRAGSSPKTVSRRASSPYKPWTWGQRRSTVAELELTKTISKDDFDPGPDARASTLNTTSWQRALGSFAWHPPLVRSLTQPIPQRDHDLELGIPPRDPRKEILMVDVLNPREMTAEQFKDMSKGRDSPPPAAETRIEAVGMGFLHPEVEHGSTESRPSTSMGSCADPMGSLRRRPNALVPETPMHDAEGGLLNHQNVNAVDKMRKDAAHVLAVMEDVGPLSYRQSPWKLMRRDIAFFAGHFTTIPRLFGGAEGPSEPVTSAMGHLLMVFTSLVITVFCVVAFAVLSILIAVLYLFALSAHLFQGDLIRHSKASKTLRYAVRPDGTRDTDANNDYTEIQHREVEKWFFVNGIATLGSGAQAAIDHLHEQTGRSVTSIHNRSLGAWFDLVECILMRDLHLNTANIRNGYKYIYQAIADPTLEKVVLIGHSQGGIIVTAWVDQLVTDFSREMLRKLEVYTFASAADHFSRARPGSGNDSVVHGHDGLFGRVEHFANTGDFVAQYGVLNPDRTHSDFPSESLQVKYGRFTGRIFSREFDGHSLLGHYLCSQHPDNSILQVPGMDEVSRLASYLDGENRLPYDSWMEDSNGDEVPGSWRNRKGDEIKDKE